MSPLPEGEGTNNENVVLPGSLFSLEKNNHGKSDGSVGND